MVRIYRRDKRGVAGVVEDVRTGCFHSFRSAPDLWAIVATPDPERPHEEEPQ